jgi:hypothetical protein
MSMTVKEFQANWVKAMKNSAKAKAESEEAAGVALAASCRAQAARNAETDAAAAYNRAIRREAGLPEHG